VEKVLIKHLGNYTGQEVLIKGWLYNKRSSGKICFLIVRDGTGLVQGVVEKKAAGEDLFSLAGNITQESSLMLRGTVREEPRAPGGFEIQVTGLEIVHMAEPYPISL